MHSVWYPAPQRLKGVLAGIWSVQAAPAAELRARVLPDGTAYVVVQRDEGALESREGAGDPQRCDWLAWSPTAVSGPRSGSFDIRLRPTGRILIVQLHAAGARSVLGAPLSMLRDAVEELGAVAEALPASLRELLASEAGDRACVRALEAWVARRAQREALRCDVTEAAVREVDRTGGTIPVDTLAERMHLSRRQLGRVLRERVGLAPKLFARITRFDRAVQSGRFRPEWSLAEVACRAGYADQAHMSREFLALGGIRPSELRGKGAAWIW